MRMGGPIQFKPPGWKPSFGWSGMERFVIPTGPFGAVQGEVEEPAVSSACSGTRPGKLKFAVTNFRLIALRKLRLSQFCTERFCIACFVEPVLFCTTCFVQPVLYQGTASAVPYMAENL